MPIKAARNSDIMMIFLLNSAIVGLVGGLLGICLGTGISSVLPLLGMGMVGPGGMTTVIILQLLIFALLLSMGIGMAA